MKEDASTFKVAHKGCKYNIYEFLTKHPGGVNYIKPYKEKDITSRMKDTYHSKAAYYLLREYKDGERDQNDQDLEKLVDWDKPMLSQVGNLREKYKDWVRSPVDRQLRLFENPILENLTITPWYIVPIVWIPVIIYFIIHGIHQYVQITKDNHTFIPTVLSLGIGLLIWTILEYSLHRWVFHIEPSGKSTIMIYVHFAIHGLHHKVPFDSGRLVFPPVPAAVIIYIFYNTFSKILPEFCSILVMAGILLGYLIYDMIHFYLHYGAPSENSYFYNLKRYHNQHHFSYHGSVFGISSSIWDKMFNTSIELRKLALEIKW